MVAIFEENDVGASKYSKKERADYRRLLELVKENKVDVIFVTEVERLMRQPAEAEQLIDLAGATDLREIHPTSEEGYNLSTPNGVYGLRQAVKLAERESLKTSERLRRTLADRARNGQTHGSRRCFGYKAGNMEIDEAEAFILREMGDKLLAGCSFKEIAYWANEQGYKTAEGKMWYSVTIRNSLRRVRYAGFREHKGERYPATWPAIFRQAWEANEGISRRRALIDTVVERIDVFPGIRKPFVNVDGVTMRFDKDRVMITWRKADTLAA